MRNKPVETISPQEEAATMSYEDLYYEDQTAKMLGIDALTFMDDNDRTPDVTTDQFA